MAFPKNNKSFFKVSSSIFSYLLRKKESLFDFPSCTPSGARTLDPLIKSQLLYQLS